MVRASRNQACSSRDDDGSWGTVRRQQNGARSVAVEEEIVSSTSSRVPRDTLSYYAERSSKGKVQSKQNPGASLYGRQGEADPEYDGAGVPPADEAEAQRLAATAQKLRRAAQFQQVLPVLSLDQGYLCR